jgi:hypothetical protein
VEDVKPSLDRLIERGPIFSFPFHGVVIRDPAAAVAQLKHNLDAVMENYPTTRAWLANKPRVYKREGPVMLDPLLAVSYPKWCRDIATEKAIPADDGSVFLSDCGKARENLYAKRFHYDKRPLWKRPLLDSCL